MEGHWIHFHLRRVPSSGRDGMDFGLVLRFFLFFCVAKKVIFVWVIIVFSLFMVLVPVFHKSCMFCFANFSVIS